MCGDFNIKINSVKDKSSKELANLLCSLNLIYSNSSPTNNYSKSCLDNIIVNFSSDMFKIYTVGGGFADHIPLLFNFFSNTGNLTNTSTDTIKQMVWRQNGRMIQSFTEKLKSEQWEMVIEYQRVTT